MFKQEINGDITIPKVLLPGKVLLTGDDETSITIQSIHLKIGQVIPASQFLSVEEIDSSTNITDGGIGFIPGVEIYLVNYNQFNLKHILVIYKIYIIIFEKMLKMQVVKK